VLKCVFLFKKESEFKGFNMAHHNHRKPNRRARPGDQKMDFLPLEYEWSWFDDRAEATRISKTGSGIWVQIGHPEWREIEEEYQAYLAGSRSGQRVYH
jgi:hypothetical protein